MVPLSAPPSKIDLDSVVISSPSKIDLDSVVISSPSKIEGVRGEYDHLIAAERAGAPKGRGSMTVV